MCTDKSGGWFSQPQSKQQQSTFSNPTVAHVHSSSPNRTRISSLPAVHANEDKLQNLKCNVLTGLFWQSLQQED